MFVYKKMVVALISSGFLLSTQALAADGALTIDIQGPQVVSHQELAPSVVEASTASDETTAIDKAHLYPRYHEVKANESIWSIASQYVPANKSVNEYQIIASIYRHNPKAFGGGNLNNLHKVTLVIPSLDAISLEKEQSGHSLLKYGKVKLPDLPQNSAPYTDLQNRIVINPKANVAATDSQISQDKDSQKSDKSADPLQAENVATELKTDLAEANLENKASETAQEEPLNTDLEAKSQVQDTEAETADKAKTSLLEQSLQALQQEVSALKAQKEQEALDKASDKKDLETLVSKYEGTIDNLKGEISEVKGQLDKLKDENSALKNQTLGYEESLAKLEGQLEEQSKQAPWYQLLRDYKMPLLVILGIFLLLIALRRKKKTELKAPIEKKQEPEFTAKSQNLDAKVEARSEASEAKERLSSQDKACAFEIEGAEEAEEIDASASSKACASEEIASESLNKDVCAKDKSELSPKFKSLRRRVRAQASSKKEEKTIQEQVKEAVSEKAQDKPISESEDIKTAQDESLAHKLYQHDDDYIEEVIPKYDDFTQHYKDRLELAKVYLDTGDIEDAKFILEDTYMFAPEEIAKEAKILLSKYADNN